MVLSLLRLISVKKVNMKRLILILMLMATGLTSGLFQAQINVNININSQPKWGPSGYDYVESYYLPEYDLYYNVPKRGYYYSSGSRWIFSPVLPVRYRHIDLYRTHKVVLVDRYPYKRHKVHYNQYASYRVNHAPPLLVRHYNGNNYHKKNFKNHYKSPKYKYAKVGHQGNFNRGKNKHFKMGNHPKPNKHHKGGPRGHR